MNIDLNPLIIDRIATPNPNTMKFCVRSGDRSCLISPDFPMEYNKMDTNINSPLARALLEKDSVESVFYGMDFISVTKTSDDVWEDIQSDIVFTILNYDHDLINGKIFDSISVDDDEVDCEETDKETVALIQSFLDEVIRPQIAMDGGDIQLKAYKNKIAYLKLKGACSSCPSASQTLYYGVREMLINNIPELYDIEQV